MSTTIIIPNINSEEVIVKCIKSINNKILPIYVIDNGSNDNCLKIIKSLNNNITIFEMKKNLGWGNAANFGISKCKTDYALLLNPDVEFLSEKPIDLFYANARKYNNFGSGSCLTIDEDNKTDNGRIVFYTKIKKKNTKFTNVVPTGHTCSTTNCVFGGAIIYFKVQAFKISGGFDKNCFLYLEEDDLNFRIQKNGFTNIIFPEIIARHLGSKSAKIPNLTWWKNWHWAWSHLYFKKKFLYKKKFFNVLIIYLLLKLSIKCLIYLLLNKKKYYLMSGRFNGTLSFLLKKKAMDNTPNAFKNNARGIFGKIKNNKDENFTLSK
jgi:GT2 family glycosyltransferase